MAELTPMKKQYNAIKAQHPDCLLFFRLGDFYEMFDDDAILASRELELTLTTRDRNVENPEERTPMCGVPFHAAETYIARLIQKGYKVAICEQMEDPALAKGLVKRDVIRVITPGTVTDASMLEEGRPNYLAAVTLTPPSGAVAFCDISTGEFYAADFRENSVEHILNELSRFSPREAIVNAGALESPEIAAFLRERLGALTETGDERFDYMGAAVRLCSQFGAEDVDALEFGDHPGAVCAAGALLQYISETQRCELGYLRRPELYGDQRYMELDDTTRRNLELTESLRSGEKRGSLLWVLDKTKTPMGGRLLRAWVERPLLSPVQIKKRQSAVRELVSDSVLRSELMLSLREIGDIQRLIGRAVYGSANARDLAALGGAEGKASERPVRSPARDCRDRSSGRRDGPHPARDLRRAADLPARGRHPPRGIQRAGGSPAQGARQRRADDRGARAARARKDRHQEAQGRLQPRVRLLSRRAEQREGGAAGLLHPQADACFERAVFYPRAQGAGEHAHERA